jgi:hypothetical protein
LVEHISGEPEVLEPDRIENWKWYPIDNLPQPIFEFTQRGLDGYKANNGISYFSVKEV